MGLSMRPLTSPRLAASRILIFVEPERWLRLWQAIGASGDASTWYETLTRAYAELHRHYHNQQHIADCLAEFDAVRLLAKQPYAVELALWFHDAVYDPKAADNEEQSAALARCCLQSAGLHASARRTFQVAGRNRRRVF